MDIYDELYSRNYKHAGCNGRHRIKKGTANCESCVKIAQVREKCRVSRSRTSHVIHEENTEPILDITKKSFKEYLKLCVRRIKKFAATGFARINAFRRDDISNIVFVMVDRTNSRSRCSFLRIDSNGNTQRIPRDSFLGTNLLNSLPNILSPDQHSYQQKIPRNLSYHTNAYKRQHAPQRLRFNITSPILSIQSIDSICVNVSSRSIEPYDDNYNENELNNSSYDVSETATSQIFSTKAQLSQSSSLSNNQTDINTPTPCPIKNVSSNSVLKSKSNIRSSSIQESCNLDKEMRYMRLQQAISHELRDLVAANNSLESHNDSINITKSMNTYPSIFYETPRLKSKRYEPVHSQNHILDSPKSSTTTFDKESDTSQPLRTSTDSTVVSSTTVSIKRQIFSKIAKGRNALIPPKLPASKNINKIPSLTNTKLNKGNLGTVSRLVELFEERRIFSGIQPTGVPHIGNYLGTLKKWVELQNTSELSTVLLFCIADLHAITMSKNPIELKKHKREMFVALEAIGIDTERSIVPYHSELAWIFNCIIPISHLQRMTQWKTKSFQYKNTNSKSNLGLFSYPVLQAADILLATEVPVGQDQIQHLELTCTISRLFNKTFSKNIFTSPKALLTPSKRIMSLRNPKQKMSKSDPNPNSRILITDSLDIIESKISHAITDSYNGITYDPSKRPGIANLLQILASLDYPASDPAKIAKDNVNLTHKAFKCLVTKSIYTFFAPIRERYQCIMSRNISSYIEQNKKGAQNAQKLALHTMEQVKTCIGLL
ncbi:hypothetical protein PMAC_003169 [Pneumocystis sp. 'macacae']|nr:hypothetical protein PMAC_003169 [Pneumocystis sp. 'macacae']